MHSFHALRTGCALNKDKFDTSANFSAKRSMHFAQVHLAQKLINKYTWCLLDKDKFDTSANSLSSKHLPCTSHNWRHVPATLPSAGLTVSQEPVPDLHAYFKPAGSKHTHDTKSA